MTLIERLLSVLDEKGLTPEQKAEILASASGCAGGSCGDGQLSQAEDEAVAVPQYSEEPINALRTKLQNMGLSESDVNSIIDQTFGCTGGKCGDGTIKDKELSR